MPPISAEDFQGEVSDFIARMNAIPSDHIYLDLEGQAFFRLRIQRDNLRIDLNNNNFFDEPDLKNEIEGFGKVLAAIPPQVTHLSLGYNGFGELGTGFADILKAIPPTVTHLDLAANDLVDDSRGKQGDLKGLEDKLEDEDNLPPLRNILDNTPDILNEEDDVVGKMEYTSRDIREIAIVHLWQSTPARVAYLTQHVADYRINRYIYTSNNADKNKMLEEVFAAIPSGVTHLGLAGNNLCALGVKALGRILPLLHAGVSSLDLSSNNSSHPLKTSEEIAGMLAAIPTHVSTLGLRYFGLDNCLNYYPKRLQEKILAGIFAAIPDVGCIDLHNNGLDRFEDEKREKLIAALKHQILQGGKTIHVEESLVQELPANEEFIESELGITMLSVFSRNLGFFGGSRLKGITPKIQFLEKERIQGIIEQARPRAFCSREQ